MGGWELIIALFGGAWYVISAITAANEKKKKKAKRKMALEAESMSLKKDSQPLQQDKTADSLMEKSRAVDMISEAMPQPEVSFAKPINSSVSTPNVSGKDAGIMREARKAILDSMRKELGLPTQAKQPTRPQSIKVPEARPPKPARPAAASSDPQTTKPRRRPRPMAPKTAQKAPESTSGEALAGLLKSQSGLKQAMILSEIFQPPVSLRSQHLS